VSRPRVLILTKTTALGGAERLLANSLPHLDRDSFDYRLGACDADGPLAGTWSAAGLPFRRLPGAAPLDPRSVLSLRRELVRERIDLVHAHLPLPGVAARLAARGLPTRVVYTEHNTQDAYGATSRELNRATYGWQHAVIAVSARVGESAVACVGAAAVTRTTVIPNGLDLAALDRGASGPVDAPAPPRDPGGLAVLVPATLARRKGQDVALEAFARLAARPGPSPRLWLAGSGPDHSALEARARRLGLGDAACFLGRRSDVFALMRSADVVALPSRFEGHPLALLEAMALGRPVVAATVGGIPEIVRHGRTGLLVPPGSPDAFANAVERLRGDPTLRRRLGEAAARDVRARFDVRATVAATEALYRLCLGRPECGGSRVTVEWHASRSGSR
jgi:glycosyltransferase involved in cell wall biosynthesis